MAAKTAAAADFNKQYLHTESRSWWEILLGGFLGGLGIGIMIALLIRVTRRKREEQQKL